MNYTKVYKSCSLFGSLRMFSNIKNSVHLINGPSGCSYFNSAAVFERNKVKIKKAYPKIFSTNFNENDVVFGGIEKLSKAISEIIDKYKPDVLFVYNCCVTEIIGENIDDICGHLAKEHNVKIIPVKSAGFKGDHKYGMIEASKILCEQFWDNASRVLTEKRTINILGEFDINNSHVKELVNILIKAGIEINCIFPGNCSIKEIMMMPSANLNYVYCGNAALNIAKYLKQSYDIPYIIDKNSYMGIDNCVKMVDDIFNFFGINNNMHKELYERNICLVNEYKNYFKGKTAVIVSGTSKALGYAEMLKILGVDIQMIFTEGTPDLITEKDFLQYSTNIFCDAEAEDLSLDIKRIDPDYVIGILTEIIFPEPYLLFENTGFNGISGTLQLAKYLQEYEQTPTYKYLKMLRKAQK